MKPLQFKAKALDDALALVVFEMSVICNWAEADGVFYVCHDASATPCTISSIQQSTGLNDKNGVEIFEGDVLNWNGIGRAVVEWSEGDADFLPDYADLSLGGFDTRPTLNGLSSAKFPCFEVIGNKWANPELLPQPEASVGQ